MEAHQNAVTITVTTRHASCLFATYAPRRHRRPAPDADGRVLEHAGARPAASAGGAHHAASTGRGAPCRRCSCCPPRGAGCRDGWRPGC